MRNENALILIDFNLFGLLENLSFKLWILCSRAVEVNHHIGDICAIGDKTFVRHLHCGTNSGIFHRRIALDDNRCQLRGCTTQNDLALDRTGLG